MINCLKPDTCIIFNPTARGDKARYFRCHLDELSAQAIFKPTSGVGAATELAFEAVNQGFSTIVAAGGDGTINEVVNGIALHPEGLKQVCLGIIPLGTVNVFAKELGLPGRIPSAWQIIQNGRARQIDLGVAEYGPAGQEKRRFFVQLAGAGMDSKAIDLVSWPLKKRIGPLAYVWAGFKAFLTPQPCLRATHASQTAQGEFVLVGNGRYYGGRLAFFPEAELDDGLLDVCIFSRVTFLGVMHCLFSLLFRQRPPQYGVQTMRCAAFRLTSESRVLLELDGENVGEIPVSFSLRRRALRVLF